MLNWQYLKYFTAVAEEEHFTRAAAKLFITQPALSKAMANLESKSACRCLSSRAGTSS